MAAEYLSSLPTEERRQNGQVYTPPHLVEFVLKQAGYADNPSGPIIDPACGAGAFLEGAVSVLAAATIRQGRSRAEFVARVEHELLGVDVDEHACGLARQAVRRAVQANAPGPLSREFFARNIACADFLTDDLGDVLGRAFAERGFAFVVGNPPYVSATRIDAKTKTRLRGTFSTAAGRLDLYTLFIERAVRVLVPGGRAALITPDKFLVSQSARTLRGFLADSTDVRSIALFSSHKVFASAATVPCVSVFERGKRAPEVEVLRCVDGDNNDPGVRVLERATVPQRSLTSAPWYLSTSGDLALARRLQGSHPRLAQFTLRVSAGPATGRDRIFVFPKGEHPEIERELVRPAVRGRDVDAYGISDPALEILVPYVYDRTGAATLIDLTKFPGAARYLARHRAELRARHCVRVWGKDWHDLHDQPLGDLAAQTKILVPDVANSNRFAVDVGRYFPLHSAYYLVPKPGVDPFFLLGVLNSSLAAFFVRVFSPVVKDGFNRYRQQFLAEIPVPLATDAEQQEIARAARRGDAEAVNAAVEHLFRLSPNDRHRILALIGGASS